MPFFLVAHHGRKLSCWASSYIGTSLNVYVDIFNGIVYTLERLDQNNLYPNLEVPGLACPGRDRTPAWNGGTLEKSHPDRYLACDMAPPSACVT